MIVSLILAGGCSSKQTHVNPVIECVPEIQVIESFIPVPSELAQIWENPPVPSQGTNAALLDWAQACAITTRHYREQALRLRELE